NLRTHAFAWETRSAASRSISRSAVGATMTSPGSGGAARLLPLRAYGSVRLGGRSDMVSIILTGLAAERQRKRAAERDASAGSMPGIESPGAVRGRMRPGIEPRSSGCWPGKNMHRLLVDPLTQWYHTAEERMLEGDAGRQ